MKNMLEITGRVAIVTGASKGIGAATARVLAEHGADLVIAGRDAARLSEAAEAIRLSTGRIVLPVPADVTREADAVRLVERSLSEFGKIDILVNNVGGPRRSPLETTTLDDWEHVIGTNLRSAFLCTREAGRHMIARGKGAIVNVSSLAALNAVSFAGAYGAAKAGLQNFTQATSNAWARHGVRTNAVAAGSVGHTPSRESPERVAAICAATPMRRQGRPEEIGYAVLFLASDAASYITGATLVAGGGQVDPEPSNT